MGTNYYLHQKPPCESCGRPYEPLHIGKSSVGWCFALHVIPGVADDLDAWRVLWAAPGAWIEDEYGERISIADMEKIITQRSRERRTRDWWAVGYASEKEFHDMNESEQRPNGLLRARIGGRCVAHGAGTWDCFVGEFS